MKILSIHDLATIRKRAEHNLSLREESNEKVTEKCYGLASGAQHLQILICGGTGCKASSSQGIRQSSKSHPKERNHRQSRSHHRRLFRLL